MTLRELDGSDLKALRDQATELRRADRLTEAEVVYRVCATLAPMDPVSFHFLASIHSALGDLDQALWCAEKAYELSPGTAPVRAQLGAVLLTRGDYRRGLPLFAEQREPVSLPFPEWKGEDLAGRRLLVLPEQGLGDQIQFARFLADLRDRGAEVGLITPPPLRRLFSKAFSWARVLNGEADMAAFAPDLWTSQIAMTVALGVTLENAGRPAYLPAAVRPAVGIGVVTRGNPIHPNDAWRSLPEDAAARLLDLPGAVSLAPEATGAGDMADTAEIVCGLDLVITVDTSVAHLCGAMGRPCWVLLTSRATDWRWGRVGDTTPWYESLRLFRQETAGDWVSVIDRVRHALAARG